LRKFTVTVAPVRALSWLVLKARRLAVTLKVTGGGGAATWGAGVGGGGGTAVGCEAISGDGVDVATGTAVAGSGVAVNTGGSGVAAGTEVAVSAGRAVAVTSAGRVLVAVGASEAPLLQAKTPALRRRTGRTLTSTAENLYPLSEIGEGVRG
jgi:hypothetical protein